MEKYRDTVRGVCRARAFPGELPDLEASALLRIIEKRDDILAVSPEKRRAYVRMVAANAAIDWLNKNSPPACYALTPDDLARLFPHFASLGLSPVIIEDSGLLNRQFFRKRDFMEAARSAVGAAAGSGDMAENLCEKMARQASKRAEFRAFVENADEHDENDAPFLPGRGADAEQSWAPETGDGSMPISPSGLAGGVSPEDGDAALCLVSALKDACDGGKLDLRQLLAFFYYWYEKNEPGRGAAVRCAAAFGLNGPDGVAELDRKVKRILREKLKERENGHVARNRPSRAAGKGGRHD